MGGGERVGRGGGGGTGNKKTNEAKLKRIIGVCSTNSSLMRSTMSQEIDLR